VFSAGGIPKEAQLSRREHIQRKSFWQLKFVRKEFEGSQTVADKSLTDVRRWRISVGHGGADRWLLERLGK